MRTLGFSKKWDKLQQPEFTTFRFVRADRDWYVGEQVRIVYQPRRKGGGEQLGVAEILNKERRTFSPLIFGQPVSGAEAKEDGFPGPIAMFGWLEKTYGPHRLNQEPMNKLTLKWISRVPHNRGEGRG